MVLKNRNQIENCLALMLLGLVVGMGIYVTVVLYFSPSAP